MKKIITILAICAFFTQVQAQQLQIQDTSIVLVEGAKKVVLDSIQIENRIGQIKKVIEVGKNEIKEIELQKIEKQQSIISAQNTLLYLIEIREKYNTLLPQLKKQTKKK